MKIISLLALFATPALFVMFVQQGTLSGFDWVVIGFWALASWKDSLETVIE